jgi:hypothetical protein
MFDIGAVTHVAHAVEDLDVTMEAMGAALGLVWATVQQREMVISEGGEIVSTDIRFTYSRNTARHVELIEGQPDTIWAPARGLHHMGVWSDDLAGDAARLSAAGFTEDAAGVTRSGRSPFGFTYHSSPTGLRLELVDVASRPAFDRWLAGGDFDL